MNPSCPTGATACVVDNNHFITSASPSYATCSGTCSATTDLTETDAVAQAAGYTDVQTFARAPIGPTSPTVGQGTSRSAYCTTIGSAFSGSSAAGTACASDTTYGVTYATATHTVSGDGRVVVARSTWDIGAYQYNPNAGSPTMKGILSTKGQAVGLWSSLLLAGLTLAWRGQA